MAKPFAWVLVVALVSGIPKSWAFDRVGFSYGRSSSEADVDVYRVALRDFWRKRWFTEGDWYLSGYWELLVGHWSTGIANTGHDTLNEVAARAVGRLQRRQGVGRMTPYVELGTGGHLLTSVRIANENLSTAFQFGSHVGLGVLFGKDNRYELGWRLMHLSNASIKRPNPGINFNLFHIGIRF